MALPNITITITNAERVAIQHSIWPTINRLEDKSFRLGIPVKLTVAEDKQLATLRRLNERLTIPSN